MHRVFFKANTSIFLYPLIANPLTEGRFLLKGGLEQAEKESSGRS